MYIDDSTLDELEQKALESPRLRMNLNLHDSEDEPQPARFA